MQLAQTSPVLNSAGKSSSHCIQKNIRDLIKPLFRWMQFVCPIRHPGVSRVRVQHEENVMALNIVGVCVHGLGGNFFRPEWTLLRQS